MLGETISHYKVLEKIGEGGMVGMPNKAVVSIRRLVYVWSFVLLLGLTAFPAVGQERTGSSESGPVTGEGSGTDDDRIYNLEDGVTMPEILEQTTPSYTKEAIEAKVEGIVILEVVFRKDGRVDRFRVLREPGYGLAEKAIQEIEKNWRFRPGTLDGKPVDVPATIEVQFNLLDPNLLVNYAQNGDSSAVRKLLDSGVKVDAKNEQGTTALMVAAQEGHTPTVRLLLDAGAKGRGLPPSAPDPWSCSRSVAVASVQLQLPSGLEKDIALFLEQRPGRAPGRRLASLMKYVERHPAGWKKRLEAGRLLRRLGRLDEAFPHYYSVVRRQPRLISAWMELAGMHSALGCRAEAECR